MSLALYRKYRPKLLADLLGQEINVQILRNTAKLNKFAHAYLFYGARGTGKTTAARLVAKIVNCEKRLSDKKFHNDGEPCNNCRICTEIDNGSALDVIEIDAASNRGIDEIRNLKESAQTTPASYSRKVFIIDEVHMLTGPAFNALLKTLEEPPEHVMFILATTEFDKLPATITSRTQRFLFKKLSKQIIVKKLESICRTENIEYDTEALELIAVAAEGGLRDAESLLEQVHSLPSQISKGNLGGRALFISAETVERAIGRVGAKKLREFSSLLATKDLSGALVFLNDLNNSGTNVVQFAKDLIHYLRRVLSLKLNPALEELFQSELTNDDIAEMKNIGSKNNPDFFIKLLKSLIRSYTDMRYSPFAMVPLEVTVIEILKS